MKFRMAIIAGGSFALGYLACLMFGDRRERDEDDKWVAVSKEDAEDSGEEGSEGETVYAKPMDDDHVKMVVAVRKDLKMKEGKIGAQVAHAAVDCAQEAMAHAPDLIDLWEDGGSTKVCLKIDGEEALLELEEKCRKAGLVVSLIEDAGRTQIAAGSRTVCGVFGPASVIDECCGHLKLL